MVTAEVYMESHGLEVDQSAGEAPWQHGICERMVQVAENSFTKMARRGISEDAWKW